MISHLPNKPKILRGKEPLNKEVYKSTDNQKKIIAEITKNKNITIKELANTVGINDNNIQKNLKTLGDNGLVKRVGSKIKGHWEVIK